MGYDVEKETKAGKENRAYVSEGQAAPSTRPTSSAGGKWANNYVPYDGFPQGSKEDVVNGTNGGLEKGDSEKKMEVGKNGEIATYRMKKSTTTSEQFLSEKSLIRYMQYQITT